MKWFCVFQNLNKLDFSLRFVSVSFKFRFKTQDFVFLIFRFAKILFLWIQRDFFDIWFFWQIFALNPERKNWNAQNSVLNQKIANSVLKLSDFEKLVLMKKNRKFSHLLSASICGRFLPCATCTNYQLSIVNFQLLS